jgi:hypothetical protein
VESFKEAEREFALVSSMDSCIFVSLDTVNDAVAVVDRDAAE